MSALSETGMPESCWIFTGEPMTSKSDGKSRMSDSTAACHLACKCRPNTVGLGVAETELEQMDGHESEQNHARDCHVEVSRDEE